MKKTLKRIVKTSVITVLVTGMVLGDMAGYIPDLGMQEEVYADVKEYNDGESTWYYSINDDNVSCSITDWKSRSYADNRNMELTIPNKIDGYNVTSIGDYVFHERSNLSSVEIPESVTSIRDGAFAGCSSLSNIEIPSGVISIGDWTFAGCSSLSNIEMPSSVTSIGDSAFTKCSSLSSIEIPGSVTSIGNSVFAKCSSLSSIEIPESVTSIGNFAFEGCRSLRSVEIPSSVTSIGSAAFFACSNLRIIEIPGSVTSIEDLAFGECSGLNNIKVDKSNKVYDSRNDCNAIINTSTNALVRGCGSTVIPESVTSIGNNAFDGCSSLISIEIPGKVISIGNAAFINCSSLTGIKIPESMKSIGERAFKECSNLSSIEIPESVTSIGNNAFYDCNSLTVYCSKTSYAYKYAKKYSLKITFIKEEDTTEPDTETTKTPDTEEPSTEEETTTPVTKKTQQLSVTKSYVKEYGAKEFKVNAELKKGNGKITYSSSDKKVATVSPTGEVTVKGIGICTIIVKAKETDTYKEAVAEITITVRPKKVNVSSLSVLGGKQLSVTWKKDTKAKGYELQYSTSKSFKAKDTGLVTIKNNATTTYKIKKLVKGKKYYVRIRAYKDVKAGGKNKRLYGSYSSVKLNGKIK